MRQMHSLENTSELHIFNRGCVEAESEFGRYDLAATGKRLPCQTSARRNPSASYGSASVSIHEIHSMCTLKQAVGWKQSETLPYRFKMQLRKRGFWTCWGLSLSPSLPPERLSSSCPVQATQISLSTPLPQWC